MDAPQGEHFHDRSAADRQYPRDPHRRRDRRCFRDCLRCLRALRFSRARDRIHSLGHGGAGHARRGAVARPGAGGARHRRRVRHPGPGFFREAGLLGVVYLSRHRHRSGVRVGAHQAVALARGHHHRLRAALDLPLPQCGPSMVAPHAFHVMSGFVLAALLVVCGFMFGPPADEGQIEPISSGSLAAYLFGATMIVLASFHADTAIIVFALLVAGTLFVAWRAQAATGAVAAAAIFVFAVFAEWAVRGNPDMLVLPGGPLPGIGPAATDSSVALHLIAAAIFAVGFGAAGFLAQGRSISAIIPVVWSASAVFTPLALLIALYARIAHLDRSIPFAILAVILAAAYGAATEALTRRDSRPGLPISIALFATGALGALALALTFALEKGWLTIALALMSMGCAWISMQRPIPFLRWLAAILAGIVVVRIGYEPRIVGDAVGTPPIFNWLLWGYGIPALSFWVGSHFLRRRGDDAPLRTVESAAILFTVLLAFMEIRHAVNGGDVYRVNTSLAEFGLQVCVTLAMAIGLERLRVRTGSIVHNVGAVLLTAYAGVVAIFGLMLLETPIFWPTNVGGVFINLLLLAYALPAVLALLL